LARWLVGLLEGYGFDPHLVHPLRCKAIASARLKNDQGRRRDLGAAAACGPAAGGVDRPARGAAAAGAAAPPGGAGPLRTLLRSRIHAILAGHGHDRPGGGYWSRPGRAWLASLDLPAVSRELVEDDLALIGALETVIDRLDWEIRQRGGSGPRVTVLTQLPGVGPFIALALLAEAGDVTRSGSARKLASWAGKRDRVPWR
jgi:transposase